MAEFTVTAVEDVGGDVLRVTALTTVPNPIDDDPEATREVTIEAFGWVSATSNHFDEKHYKTTDGVLTRSEKAKPRKMTDAEVGEYARRLVVEAYPELGEAKPVAFA